jgi:glutaredoxin-like protein NrdH
VRLQAIGHVRTPHSFAATNLKDTFMPVTVYSKPNCPQCELTKRDMDILGIEYESVDITQHQEQLQRLTALGYRSAPVVETDHGIWSGYDQDKIKSLVSYS